MLTFSDYHNLTSVTQFFTNEPFSAWDIVPEPDTGVLNLAMFHVTQDSSQAQQKPMALRLDCIEILNPGRGKMTVTHSSKTSNKGRYLDRKGLEGAQASEVQSFNREQVQEIEDMNVRHEIEDVGEGHERQDIDEGPEIEDTNEGQLPGESTLSPNSQSTSPNRVGMYKLSF